ncbi:FAD-dependent oxidoreductase [Microbispora rosea]|uniref:oxidoreductase n=1 Tax=Microbispora rosea TaxID=58117 RepID=UPI003430538B
MSTWANPLAQPLRIGSRTLRNRMVMTPHLGRLGAGRLPAYLSRRAEAGVAMAILPAGMGVMNMPVYPPDIVAGLEGARGDQDGVPYHPRDERYETKLLAGLGDVFAGFANTVQRHGAVAIGQIHHPGAERSWDSFSPALAPSALRGDEFGTVPHALSGTEIGNLIEGYVGNAGSIAANGFDGVELHASHGYLLNRFISPYYNRRTDEWAAGSTLLVRLLERIRERIGSTPLLGLRLQVSEEIEGGLTPEMSARIACDIAPYLDYLSVSIGNHNGLRNGRPSTPYTSPWLTAHGPAVDGARAIRTALAEAGLERPLLVTGRITTAAFAREILERGDADLIGAARAYIADPDFAAKAISGRGEEIALCIGCNECVRVPLSCPVNPDAGREGFHAGSAPESPKRIVVVGAGPAGATAAAKAAERGHEVILLDREDAVGGTLRRLVASPMLEEWSALVGKLEREVRATGVDFRPGTEANEETLAELAPDKVIWAVGAEPLTAPFPVEAPVLTTSDLLVGRRPPADVPVVVVGGPETHLEPFIAAELLAGEGRRVWLLTERHAHGEDVEPRSLSGLLSRLSKLGVEFVSMTAVTAWSKGVVHTEQVFSGAAGEIPAGAVVTAIGRVANPVPAGDEGEAYVIGDALAPRRITHAVLEGRRFGAVI